MKADFLQRFIMGNNVPTSFLYSEVTQNTLHNFSTLIYHLDTFISLAMENPCRLIIISRVLKYDKIEGAFKGKILVFFFILLNIV